jgi:hypothetical protein
MESPATASDPPNDPTVPDDSLVFRRVPPDQVVRDATGDRTVSTAAFNSRGGPLSVGLEVLLRELRHEPLVMLQGYPTHGLAGLTAARVRQPDPEHPEKRLGVTKDRDPDEPPWHGSITGKITDSLGKKLAAGASEGIVVWPPDQPDGDSAPGRAE